MFSSSEDYQKSITFFTVRVFSMTDPDIERKLIEIMRIISESDKPVGARNIADELNNRGYNIGERAVRYHLRILDERGFTKKHGYAGRTITERGKEELNEALIADRLGFVINRIDELIYLTDYDLNEKKGNVIVNISHIDKNDIDASIEIMKYAADSDIGISPKIRIFEEDSDSNITVPPGSVAVATLCSITFDGLLLKGGIPVEPYYGGTLQIKDRDPVKFLDLISYNGTSIDPIKIFMSRRSTSVLNIMDTGEGTMLANVRYIPTSAREKADEILKKAGLSDMAGTITIGGSGEELFGAPADIGKSGIPIFVGVNTIAAVQEAGIKVNTYPISTILDYSTMYKL